MTISKTTITKFLLLTIAFTFALSINYIFAAWTGPTQPPPLGNTPTPVHVGTTPQVKDGPLSITGLVVYGPGLFQGDVTLSNLTDCASLATDSSGKIICTPPASPQVLVPTIIGGGTQNRIILWGWYPEWSCANDIWGDAYASGPSYSCRVQCSTGDRESVAYSNPTRYEITCTALR